MSADPCPCGRCKSAAVCVQPHGVRAEASADAWPSTPALTPHASEDAIYTLCVITGTRQLDTALFVARHHMAAATQRQQPLRHRATAPADPVPPSPRARAASLCWIPVAGWPHDAAITRRQRANPVGALLSPSRCRRKARGVAGASGPSFGAGPLSAYTTRASRRWFTSGFGRRQGGPAIVAVPTRYSPLLHHAHVFPRKASSRTHLI
ncbi:DUF5133 domain-containing protein [Streptomyces sp. NPDC093982]|uniref:DUF5133 domain-containing protein n=1 Tax=Streptomyces sp. NPDC093982 TaxID=3155077 RepID=UPI003441A302